ncbi:hypothetical protein OG401_23885 [Kitasatospora purpeofusca]|uniref:deoxynucleotide monophosphate kinase family protein n=1 Tax=Kitasatospora purpeofusca TaxID=67352 RepID=UPI00225571A1|nr:hypothetical protein [Kitasatospora purpeofusca]MCX4687305.1 hypothetical protein [Kitasatospora purpeofusca]
MRGFGIMGLAGSGKDTLGSWLVREHGFGRVAFADPLKNALLIADPYIATDSRHGYKHPAGNWARVSDIVGEFGWERAKSQREVRRLLQNYGQSVRGMDPGFWVRAGVKVARAVDASGKPVVVTDVRYPNEADALRAAGLRLVWIDRPGIARMKHESENQLGPEDADHVLYNDSTTEALFAQASDQLNI